MKLGKINFFKRIYLAIADFRMYPYAQKEKLSTAIGYFTKLIVLASIIVAAFMTSKFFEELPLLLDMYNKEVPNFAISNGALVNEEMVEKELNKNTYLILNNDYTYNQIKSIKLGDKSYNYYVLMLSDSTILGMGYENGIYELARFDYEKLSFDKQLVANEWQSFNESLLSKIIIWICFSIAMIIVLAIIRLWSLIMYLISTYIINFMFGLKLKFSEYLKIVTYTSTLPIILEVIALILVGNVSESVKLSLDIMQS